MLGKYQSRWPAFCAMVFIRELNLNIWFKPVFVRRWIFSMIYAKVKWWIWLNQIRRVRPLHCHGISFTPAVCQETHWFNRCNIARLSSRPCFRLPFSIFQKFSVTPAFCTSFTSSQAMSLCSWHPLSPKWTVLKNHSVFSSASALEIPRRFCS